ncbi:zona pellucida sperm-binding protein 3-like isoform X1 [Sinocyclocheilus grahami]|uniref:zona pellucida sperm-binding protein 3-like isoform X1 n=1 Tax=Sinocyclocheilus grahami TaxID=75366 RepID=UPI0007ACB06B|nr:PREDICTED: zona pellucida sperm-binding protein 3-like isoform X1 [Sinocyclocheilus grahami]
MVAVIMGFMQCVLGLLVLVAFDHVYSARPKARVFHPRVLMQEPQSVDSQLREQWNSIQGSNGVQSRRPQQAPLTSNLAPSSIQSKQELLGPVKKLVWKFPKVQEEPVQPDFNFELQQPRPSDSVAVQCWENGVHVEVKQDFFGTGQLLEPSLLSLGGCAVVNVDAAAKVLIFHSALQECGSQFMVTENELVYIFTLDYRPAALQSTPIVRSSGATVGIKCHYPRRHHVSSNEVQPAWIPYASTQVAEDILVFSLKIMTDDWMFERPSTVFFLGDVLNIQASVKQYNHVPLRIFVDHCVATRDPNVKSAPMYSFIENHGCLTDAKYTGSISKFLPRVQDDKLQFQLEAFRFQQESSGDIYITCLLKASAALAQVDENHKSCSFRANEWVSSDGRDEVCGCCDASCGLRTNSVLTKVPGFQWEGKAQVGPLQVWEIQLKAKNV